MRPVNCDTLPHLVATAGNVLRAWRDTMAARTLARWWGIKLGRGCRFYGLPLIRRIPDSSIRIGDRCHFRSARWSNQVGLNRPCMLSTLREGAVIEIGEGSGFSGTVIGAQARITIGAGVLVGGNCTITDTDWHAIGAAARRADEPGKSSPVVIEDGVWLSMNVTVLKGVTIGAGTVVAAGSVVSRSLPANVIAAGAPARPLREIN